MEDDYDEAVANVGFTSYHKFSMWRKVSSTNINYTLKFKEYSTHFLKKLL